MIPLYSNVYNDFYIDTLQNYTVGEDSTWSQAIIGAYIAENTPQEEGEESVFDDPDA